MSVCLCVQEGKPLSGVVNKLVACSGDSWHSVCLCVQEGKPFCAVVNKLGGLFQRLLILSLSLCARRQSIICSCEQASALL